MKNYGARQAVPSSPDKTFAVRPAACTSPCMDIMHCHLLYQTWQSSHFVFHLYRCSPTVWWAKSSSRCAVTASVSAVITVTAVCPPSKSRSESRRVTSSTSSSTNRLPESIPLPVRPAAAQRPLSASSASRPRTHRATWAESATTRSRPVLAKVPPPPTPSTSESARMSRQ